MPSPISKSAKSIITQLLDPTPSTRMSIEQLMNHYWFLKNYESPTQSSMFDLEQTKSCKFDPSSVNAFDIISLSSGLDLSGLFGAANRTEKRFAACQEAANLFVVVISIRIVYISARSGSQGASAYRSGSQGAGILGWVTGIQRTGFIYRTNCVAAYDAAQFLELKFFLVHHRHFNRPFSLLFDVVCFLDYTYG